MVRIPCSFAGLPCQAKVAAASTIEKSMDANGKKNVVMKKLQGIAREGMEDSDGDVGQEKQERG